MTGRSRTRTPVAWCTALATAAAVPTMPISPIPLLPIGVDVRVVLVEPVRVDVGDVGAGGDVVLGEVVVDHVAEARVEHALLVQCHGQAHGHAADELRPGGARVDDPAGGEHAEQPRHPDLAGVAVDVRLGELGAERVHGVPLGGRVLLGAAVGARPRRRGSAPYLSRKALRRVDDGGAPRGHA